MMAHDYPVLLKRIQALVLDFIILLMVMVVISQVIGIMKEVPDSIRISAFILVFFLYDPLMTSIYGGTLGHMVVGIRVKKESSEDENINFPAALIRFSVKSLLGWVSLITVTGNKKKRAIHDLASGSVVKFKKDPSIDILNRTS